MARKKKETKQKPIEVQLWKATDKLRKNIDAAFSWLDSSGRATYLFNL